MLPTGPTNGLCKRLQPLLGNFFRDYRELLPYDCDLECKVLHTTLGAVAYLRGLVWRQSSGRVAALTFLRRVLIEQNILTLEVAIVLVAPGAGHILMQALERKFRALIVIEE